MKAVYPSRVDAWLAVTLVGAPLSVVASGAFLMTTSVSAGIFVILSGLGVAGVMAALLLPCLYTLTDDSLTIKSGMLEDEVPLRDILGAEKSRSLWSAPALSLRRVKITLRNGSRVISPKDRDKFIADLEARLRTSKTDRDGTATRPA